MKPSPTGQYCMPADGVNLSPKEQLLTSEEINKLASIFVSKLGIKKIRLTGGEPLVRKDILQVIEQLSQLKNHGLETIGITTNGLTLSRVSSDLKKAGVDTVNISLDTLRQERFESITRRKGFHLVLNGIRTAIETRFTNPIKLNVVIMRNVNEDEINDFVQLTKYSLIDVRFIEYMPFDGNQWKNDKMVPMSEMLSKIRGTFSNLQALRPKGLSETSKPFKVPGFIGTIGFISSMSDHFCGGCNRLRITADGNLKVGFSGYLN